MKKNNHSGNSGEALVDKAALLQWLEDRAYYCVMEEDGISAFDAYRDVIAYVRRMTTHIKIPDIGIR